MRRTRVARSILTMTIALGITVLVVLSCCDPIRLYREHAERIRLNREHAEFDRVDAEVGVLNDRYRKGDAAEARRSLLKVEQILNQVHTKSLAFMGHRLNYSRLYALERAVGNEDLANMYLVKLEYWIILELEARGIPPENVAFNFRGMTGDGAVRFIRNWDRDVNDGKDPEYLNHIKKTPSASAP